MRVILATFLTVDGVMQAPGALDEDRRGGFKHGGWQLGYFDPVGFPEVLVVLTRAPTHRLEETHASADRLH